MMSMSLKLHLYSDTSAFNSAELFPKSLFVAALYAMQSQSLPLSDLIKALYCICPAVFVYLLPHSHPETVLMISSIFYILFL